MEHYKELVDFHIHKEFGGLEMVNAQYRHKNFNKHCHETYTVSVIKTGTQKFFRSGNNHFAPQHSIILVNADDVHTGQAADGVGWSYQAIYPTELHFNFLARSIGWADNYAPYFSRPVIFDPFLAQQLRNAFYCLMNNSNTLQRETILNHALIELMSKYGQQGKEIKAVSENQYALELLKEFLNAHITDNISIDCLSKISGLSTYHLVRQFRKRFGLPPHAYQIQQRIKLAKQFIRQGKTLVSTSLELGFHDQSHFHRHFKNNMGISPGSYATAISQ